MFNNNNEYFKLLQVMLEDLYSQVDPMNNIVLQFIIYCWSILVNWKDMKN